MSRSSSRSATSSRPDPQRLERLKAGREAKDALREASREVLADGASLAMDTPPGRGWVLRIPGLRPRYFATRDSAAYYWLCRWMGRNEPAPAKML